MLFYKRIVRVKQEPKEPEPVVIEPDNETYNWATGEELKVYPKAL